MRIKTAMKGTLMMVSTNNHVALFSLIAIFFMVGCCFPSKEDKAKLVELENKFGDRYKFNLSIEGIYMEAKLKKGAKIRESDGEDIYRAFHGNEKELEEYYAKLERHLNNRSSRESFKFKAWYILNLYDSSGDWLYQIQYSSREKKLIRSHWQEHY